MTTETRFDGLLLAMSSPAPRSLAEFGATEGDLVRRNIVEHGSVLLNGFRWSDWDDLDTFVNGVVGKPLDYTERSSPRTELAPGVFTATDHPPAEEIILHTEQSYNLTVPRYLFFFGKRRAPEGGASRIADCRKVASALPSEIVDRFDREGYLLVRNYRPGLGLSWQEAFGTDDPGRLREYCSANGIEVEWIAEDHVQTRQMRWAVATHPETGHRSWFNHLAFFNLSALREELREFFADEYGPWGVPTNTFYADGTELEPEVAAALHGAYRGQELDVDVEAGEVLIVDNISTAHGRAPFVPPRELFVSMGDAIGWADLRPAERISHPEIGAGASALVRAGAVRHQA
ncbi:hypothetical protein CFN78_08635 [Amycolatopsis antarctica]|uniref:TauD/TfdA-like domain-containing protein n=1 Tax=Amycolatopsis antarctica TaxID=1854586 RepID=A0A263D5X3_9PSEU|nr:hypothetical protein CFN78_08635 [Amycolatopsis antarctica]